MELERRDMQSRRSADALPLLVFEAANRFERFALAALDDELFSRVWPAAPRLDP